MTRSSTAAAPVKTPAPAKESLLTLTEDLRALDELLTESLGEITPEVELWMQEYADKLKGKVDSIAWFIRTCEARAAGFKAPARAVSQSVDELNAKAKTEENKVVRIKEYVRLCLDRMKETKVQGDVYSLGIENNGGALSLEVAEPFKSDPSKLPAELRRSVWILDVEKIKQVAEANGGQIVVKAEKADEADVVIARIPPRGTHVRVR